VWGLCGVLGGVGFGLIWGNFGRFCSRTLVLSGNYQETLSFVLCAYVPAPAKNPKLGFCSRVPARAKIPKSPSRVPALGKSPKLYSCHRWVKVPNANSKALCALYRRLHPSPVSLPYPPRDRRSTGLLWLCFLTLVVGRGSRLSPPCHPFSLLRFLALVNSDTAQSLGTGFVG
jgi:hypothetical protein